MFSLQMADILAAAGGTVKDLAKALQTKLGNCAQPLEHRGPVTINTTLPDNSTAAALTLQNNFPGQATAFPDTLAGFGGKTPDGSNGFALNVQNGIAQFRGPIWPLFRPNWAKFVLIDALPATPGATATARVVEQQPDSANSIVGTTITITNDIGYWSGGIGDTGEASIWYTDLKNDVFEWRPRVIKTSGAGSTIVDDPDATCAEASCKPYYFTLFIDDLGSGGTCEELNGQTVLLSYNSACEWKIDGLATGGTCAYDDIRLTVTDSGADTRLTISFYNASNVLQASACHDITGHDPADLCNGESGDLAPWTSWTGWTTVGPPPDVTGPPTMILTPYLPAYSTAACGACPTDKSPNSYLFTVAGMANAFCDGCTAWNTTYTLTLSDTVACLYSAEPHTSSGTSPCSSSPYWLERIVFDPGTGIVTLYGQYMATIIGTVTFTPPGDCWDWHNEAASVSSFNGFCTDAGASFKMSVNF